MSDKSSSETAETSSSRLQLLWRKSWSALAKGLLISAIIHLLIALPIMMAPSLPGDFDVEWEGRMADLAGIGHGVDDFDDTEPVDWDEMADFQATVDKEKEEEDEEEEDEEEQEELKDEEPDTVDEEPDTVDEEPAEERPDDPPPETDEPGPDPEAEDEHTEEADETDEAVAEADDTPDIEEFEEVPGIDRSSPSNLPDLRNYGPGNARVTSLVRTDRLRDTELEPHVADLLRVVPDYRIALDGTELDPVDELDSIFMASANPEVLQETFLAVRHRFEHDEMQSLLDRRFTDSMAWETDGDHPVRPLVPESSEYRDPRRLLLAGPGLALMGQPHWFEELIGPVDEDSALGRELAEAEGGPSAFELLDGLARIEEVAEQEDTLLLLSAYGVRLRQLPGLDVRDLPSFDALRLSVSNADEPRLTIDLRMHSEAEARRFERSCPDLRRQISRLYFGSFAFLVEPLECTREGDYVVIEGDYSQSDVRRLLEIAIPLVEMTGPPSLDDLPPPPVDELPEPEDDRQR